MPSLKDVPGAMMRSFPAQTGLLAAFSVLVGNLLTRLYGVRSPVLISAFPVLILTVLAIAFVLVLIGYVLRLAIWEREPNPTQRIMALAMRRTNLDWLANIAVLMMIFIFLGAFSSFKSMIPFIHPFAWDAAFSDLDRMIFGTDPWRLTHGLIGPTGTRVFDALYGLWFVEWVVTLTVVALYSEERFKRRFIAGFCMVWALLGFVLATIFSSVGPCYLELIHHPYAERYAGLFPLKNAPGALFAQHMLASAYASHRLGAFEGISAMPSVHVALSAYLAIAARGTRWFVPALAFYALIFFASVHLGWHYAADGIAGSLGALGCWKLAAIRIGLRKKAAALPGMT